MQNRDVYSTAMIMLHALTGCCPFVASLDASHVNAIARRNRERCGSVLPIPSQFPEQLAQFLRDCWDQKIGRASVVRT